MIAAMHAAANKARTIEDLEEIIPGLAVLIDASEQSIYRPQDDQTQKNTTPARQSGTP